MDFLLPARVLMTKLADFKLVITIDLGMALVVLLLLFSLNELFIIRPDNFPNVVGVNPLYKHVKDCAVVGDVMERASRAGCALAVKCDAGLPYYNYSTGGTNFSWLKTNYSK